MGNCTTGDTNQQFLNLDNFTIKKDTKIRSLASDYQSELQQSLSLKVQILTKVKLKSSYQICYKLEYDRSYKKEWKENVKGNIHRSLPQEMEYNFGLLNQNVRVFSLF